MLNSLLSVCMECLKVALINIGAILPMLLLLDFGMGIQLQLDYGLAGVMGFIAAMVFYAVVYAKYIHDR